MWIIFDKKRERPVRQKDLHAGSNLTMAIYGTVADAESDARSMRQMPTGGEFEVESLLEHLETVGLAGPVPVVTDVTYLEAKLQLKTQAKR